MIKPLGEKHVSNFGHYGPSITPACHGNDISRRHKRSYRTFLLFPRSARRSAARTSGGTDFNTFDSTKWRKGPDGWSDRYGDINYWDPNLVSIVDSKLRLRVEKRGGVWAGLSIRETA